MQFLGDERIGPSRWENIQKTALDLVLDSNGICCFSRHDNINLLWANYTDSHKGVCLKFDILKDPEYFQYPQKITYVSEYPSFTILSEPNELTKVLLFTKSIDWQYEDEIRIVKPNTHGTVQFNKDALVEIIFGCNTTNDSIADIIKLADNNFHATYKKAQRKHRELKLDIVNL